MHFMKVASYFEESLHLRDKSSLNKKIDIDVNICSNASTLMVHVCVQLCECCSLVEDRSCT